MRSARLEIHLINVSQGDSVLIINRDLDKVKEKIKNTPGTQLPTDPIDYVPYAIANEVPLAGTVKAALLVDGGDDEYGGDVVNYLLTHGVLVEDQVYTEHLKVLVSHYHDDHMAGLRSVFKRRVEPTRKGESLQFLERFRPGEIYLSAVDRKSRPDSGRYAMFEGDVKAAHAAFPKSKLRYLQPGGLDKYGNVTKISLGEGINNIPIEVYALASGQAVYSAAEETTIPIQSVGKKPDQNDRSIVLVLQYGSFRCFLGGDIAGNGGEPGGNFGSNAMDPLTKRYFSRHADVESILGPALEEFFPRTEERWEKGEIKSPNAGYCTVMKANHHGSSSSVDVHFLATLQPLLMLISSGIKSRFHNHPTQQVINRVNVNTTPQWKLRPTGNQEADQEADTVENNILYVFITEVGDRVRGKQFNLTLDEDILIIGDIVVRPVDESVDALQQASGSDRTEGPSLQIYGSGEQSGVLDARTKLRPISNKNDDGFYPVGPFYCTDRFREDSDGR